MRRALFVMISSIFSVPLVHGGVLLSENFDELTPQLSATSVGAFTAAAGTNVDIVGGSLFGSLCSGPESGNCVDLDGSSGNPEGVLQSGSITLMPGVSYLLSYDLIGSQRGNPASVTVTLGPYSDIRNLGSGDESSGIVSNALVTVSTPTTTTLTFTSNTPGFDGALLDNVLITSSATTAAIPEPGIPALMSAAWIALWVLRWNRHRKALAH